MSKTIDCAVIGAGTAAQGFIFTGSGNTASPDRSTAKGGKTPRLTASPAIADDATNRLNQRSS
jgi:hypothetical protein